MEDRHVPNQLQQHPVSCCMSSSSYSGTISSNLTNYHIPNNSSAITAECRKTSQDNKICHSHPREGNLHQNENLPSAHVTSSFGHKPTVTSTMFRDVSNNGISCHSAMRCTEGSGTNSMFYDSRVKGSTSNDRTDNSCHSKTNGTSISLRGSSNCRRDKSPSDLEADDENDHDSLNQSETGSGSNVSVCNVGLPSGNVTVSNLGNCTSTFGHSFEAHNQASPNYKSFPYSTSADGNETNKNELLSFTDIVEENKRLLSLMEEKDRRIHLLEYKVQQLMRDTLTISEEQSRLQKENSTLLRALSKLTMSKEKHKS
jgi:hypothetical protein